MKCPEFESEKLEARDSAEFRAHRAGCEACRADLEAYDEIRELYREAAAGERYGGGRRARHRWSPPAWLPLAAAAVVLLGLIVTIVGREGGGAEEDPADAATSSAAAFVRMPVAAWATDRSIDRQFSDAWRMLESLERRN